ncbi:hypothetical protein [Synechococcus elongatus]|nr:hypothetical protein [Synechococcus elongatus]MBD2687463.1 hypothetical protein [Synechococcus elongatus FACHB-1061]AJD57834.1 hypothetical protein M744_08265 [Synechococcus elongatus UTEX 2973]MBD2586389.1 hypothetical protein [Synechococcus elongatus FACHB-242]MBD2706828.1 hypothetical protein [Synechococcus elongatus PCC 7942 = FACHB-805]UOW71463.1 putative Na -dependent transporter [Synechococcus elongatus PCC 7943]
MDSIIPVLISASVITMMVGLGSQISFSALIRLQTQRALVLRSLLGTTVLLPLLGAGLLAILLPFVERTAIAAIALMLVCPSAPLAQQRAAQAGGEHLLAIRIQLGAAILAIVTVPIFVYGFTAAFGASIWTLSALTVAGQVFGVQVLPVLAGMLWRSLSPTTATRWQPRVVAIAQLILVILSLLILVKTAPLIWKFLVNNGIAFVGMLALIGLSLGLGQVLAGRETTQQTTVAIVTAMRNPGLALLLTHQDSRLDLPSVTIGILSYLLLTIILLVIYQRQRS